MEVIQIRWKMGRWEVGRLEGWKVEVKVGRWEGWKVGRWEGRGEGEVKEIKVKLSTPSKEAHQAKRKPRLPN